MTENIDPDVRAKIDALIAKARGDDTFGLQLTSDPEAVLVAEGFSGEVLDTMTRELGDDVGGFVRCDRISCIFTYCTYWTD